MTSFFTSKTEPKKDEEVKKLGFDEWRKQREERSTSPMQSILSNKAILVVLGLVFFVMVIWMMYRGGSKSKSKANVKGKKKLKTLSHLQNKKYAYPLSDDSDLDIDDVLSDLNEDELEMLISGLDD